MTSITLIPDPTSRRRLEGEAAARALFRGLDPLVVVTCDLLCEPHADSGMQLLGSYRGLCGIRSTWAFGGVLGLCEPEGGTLTNLMNPEARGRHSVEVGLNRTALREALPGAGGVLLVAHNGCPSVTERFSKQQVGDPSHQAQRLHHILECAGTQVAELAADIKRAAEAKLMAEAQQENPDMPMAELMARCKLPDLTVRTALVWRHGEQIESVTARTIPVARSKIELALVGA